MRSARHAAGLVLLLGFALTLAAQTPSPPAATSAAASPSDSTKASPADPVLTVTPGELLILELEDSLHTGQNQTGDYAHFSTVREVVVGYQVVIPPGSNVRALLTEVKKPGRAGRSGQIAFRFEEIILTDGTTLPFEATLLRAGFTNISSGKDETRVKGEGATSKRDILTVATGAGQGAIIGVAVGGGKGAAYGGAIGAGVGLLQILLRRGPHLDLPRGMFFEVELNRELPVPQTSAALFTQQGQRASRAGVSAPSSSASSSSSSTGAFRFPDDPDAVPADREVPIPDFPEDDATPAEAGTETETAEETTTVASRRQPAPGAGAPADLPASIPAPTTGPPPPPGLDPTLGDPDAYRLKVDVRLVMVEAFVRDDRGRVLEDLTREDFRLLEESVEQEIRHFSRDELPLAVALVVDRSGSVAQFMPELRRAAYETLSQLKSGDQVALFAFAGDVDRLTDLTTDRRYIAERISRIRAGGGTNITDALAFAATYLAMAAPYRPRTIILISAAPARAASSALLWNPRWSSTASRRPASPPP
jgi:Mg-chelatase subunit ChlD